MRAARTWVFLLAVVVVTPGCVTEAEDGGDGVNVVESPDDFSYLEGGSSPNDRAHLHDYWGGKTELTVLESTKYTTWVANAGPWFIETFLPDADHVVPLGAGAVEVTVAWVDHRPGTYTNPSVFIQTAADAVYRAPIAVTNGGTVRFDIANNTLNDLPHQRLSAWRFGFGFETQEPFPSRSFEMDVTMQVRAFRGLDIPLFPAHPDHWNGTREKALVTGMAGGAETWVMSPPQCFYCNGNWPVVQPDNGVIVPPDAREVRLRLDYRSETMTPLLLDYHGSESREWTRAPLASDDQSGRSFIMPVQKNGDGPYAQQSVWRFRVVFDDSSPRGGVGPYRGDWNATATVLK